MYRLLDQLLTDDPGIGWADGQDARPLVGDVCDVAASTMSSVSYQGQHQDLNTLAHGINTQLVRGGVRPAAGDWAPLRSVAQRLAAYAQDNRQQFLRRARGE